MRLIVNEFLIDHKRQLRLVVDLELDVVPPAVGQVKSRENVDLIVFKVQHVAGHLEKAILETEAEKFIVVIVPQKHSVRVYGRDVHGDLKQLRRHPIVVLRRQPVAFVFVRESLAGHNHVTLAVEARQGESIRGDFAEISAPAVRAATLAVRHACPIVLAFDDQTRLGVLAVHAFRCFRTFAVRI